MHLSRAQYDPTKPRYVSLRDLLRDRDADWARSVAKVPAQVYRDFLKTL